MEHHTERSRAVVLAASAALLCATFALTLGASRGQDAGAAGTQSRACRAPWQW